MNRGYNAKDHLASVDHATILVSVRDGLCKSGRQGWTPAVYSALLRVSRLIDLLRDGLAPRSIDR